MELLKLCLLVTFRTNYFAVGGYYQRVRKKMLAMLVTAVQNQSFVLEPLTQFICRG
jgi:hypothetical protein